jgi:hypothetical protein
MSDYRINTMLEGTEVHNDRGSKSLSRGLLSAVAAALLALTLPAYGTQAGVAVPFLGFELPVPLAALVFLLASTTLGSFAAYHMWKAMHHRSTLSSFVSEKLDRMPLFESDGDKERDKLLGVIGPRLVRAPALMTNGVILSLAIMATLSLHTSAELNLLITFGVVDTESVFGQDFALMMGVGFLTWSPYLATGMIYLCGRLGYFIK